MSSAKSLKRKVCVSVTLNCPVVLVFPLSMVGNDPSVVYLSVVPAGMVTLTLNGVVKSCEGRSTTGASSCALAKRDVALLFPGVALAANPHCSPPSVVRA